MGLIYDVFTYRSNGTLDRDFNANVSRFKVHKGRYTKVVNTNGGDGTTWYAPSGKIVAEADLPWVRAERERAERQAEIERRRAIERRARCWADLERPGGVEIRVAGYPVTVWGDSRDQTVTVRILSPDRRQRLNDPVARPLALWHQAVAEWADGLEDDLRTHLYATLDTILPDLDSARDDD